MAEQEPSIGSPTLYRFGDHVDLAAADSDTYLVSGFSFREDWGRWTDGPNARIELTHGLARGTLLVEIMVARAFCAEDDICDLIVDIGWSEPKLFSLGPGEARLACLALAEETYAAGRTIIDLLIVRPKRRNEAPDVRALGVGVRSIRLVLLPEAAQSP